jgi:hypothetical protein
MRAVACGLCKLYSGAGVIVIGGGLEILGFGFAGVPSPEAAAVAEPASFVLSLGAATLGFRFGAPASLGAAVEAALSLAAYFSAVALRFGFAAGASDAVAAWSLSFAAAAFAAPLFFFSGLESVVACEGGAGGLVPV